MNSLKWISVISKLPLAVLFVLALSLPAQARSVRVDFSKARQAFERGNLRSAAKILRRIVKSYPNHKASYYLLGRIYYQAGHPKYAARFFRRSGASFAGPDSAFEYGISMFSVGNCRKAQQGFRRVRGSDRDLARFYSGVCLIKAKRWFDAEMMLRAAKRLPPNLETKKRQFLIEIRRKRDAERRGAVTRAIPYTPVPVPVPPPPQLIQPKPGYPNYDQNQALPPLPPGPGYPGETKKKRKKKKETPKVRKGFDFVITPEAEYTSETVTKNRHSFGEKKVTTDGPSGKLSIVPQYFYPPRKNGQQTSLSLKLEASASDKKERSKDVTFVETDEGEIGAESEVETEKAKFYKILAGPTGTFPIDRSITLTPGVDVAQKFPDMKSENPETEISPYGSATIGFGSFNLQPSGKYSAFSKNDDDGNPIDTAVTNVSLKIDTSFDGAITVTGVGEYSQESNPKYEKLDGYESTNKLQLGVTKVWEGFEFGLTGKRLENTHPGDTVISGPSELLIGELGVTKSLPLGLTITLTGEFAQINDYFKTKLSEDPDNATEENSTQTATASATRTGGKALAKFAPIDWASATVSYSTKTTTYAVQQKELEADFQRKVADLVTELTFSVGVSKSF